MTDEQNKALVERLEEWQRLENHSMSSCSNMLEKSRHPVIRLVLETILSDSKNHYHVLGMVIDSLGKDQPIKPEEARELELETARHEELEERIVHDAESLVSSLEERGEKVPAFLLRYLLDDERKHHSMLARLRELVELPD